MLKTVVIIVFSVSLLGVLFFFYVKKKLKQHLDYYLSRDIERNKK